MFRDELKDRFERIFSKRVEYAASGAKFEQDVIFIEIAKARSKVSRPKRDGKMNFVVDGEMKIFTSWQKYRYGFFSAAMERAEASLKKEIFVFEKDTENLGSPFRTIDNIEMTAKFVAIISVQFDPDAGSLSSLDIQQVVSL